MPYHHPLPEASRKKLDALYAHMEEAAKRECGYPCNLDFDYSELFRFLKFSLNNVGDPFESSHYQVNTHAIECEVLSFFAKLLHLEGPYSGYVTSGGTEGNLYGLNIANQMYPHGVIYYSDQTHYSIPKILRIIHSDSEKVASTPNGEIDYEALAAALHRNKDKPAIINANIGTTMKGAIDNVKTIKTLLNDAGIKEHYIHCDAALSGMILPFVDDPQPFTFQEGVQSISVSGHKFIGSPLPCGIALTQSRNFVKALPRISYVRSTDSTISSSRSGLTPLFLWYALQRHGLDGFKQMCAECLDNTQYAVNRLKAAGIEAWSNKNSITVVFPKPAEAIMQKWQLANDEEIAHIITVPSVSREMLREVTDDLIA